MRSMTEAVEHAGAAGGLTAARDRWRERLAATPERSVLFSTISGVENEPLYGPGDVAVDHDRDLGYPARSHSRAACTRPCTGAGCGRCASFAGFGSAVETNERFRYLLEHGQTGLSTAFDMPTLMGLDSDHSRSLGEVGREGVAVDSLDDMRTLFSGIPLRRGVDVDDDQPRPPRCCSPFYLVHRRGAGRAAR